MTMSGDGPRELCAICGYPASKSGGACCAECGGIARVPALSCTAPLRRGALVASLAAIAAVFAGELAPRAVGWAAALGIGVRPLGAAMVMQVGAIAGAIVAGGVLVHALHQAARDDAAVRRRVAVIATVLAAITAACVTVAPYMLARTGPRAQDDPVIVLWSSLRAVLPTAAIDLWLGVSAVLLGAALRRDAGPAAHRGSCRVEGMRLLAVGGILELATIAHVALVVGGHPAIAAAGAVRLVARWLVLPFALSAAAGLLRRVPATAVAVRCRRAQRGVLAAIGLGVALQLVAMLGLLPRAPWLGWLWWLVDGTVIAASIIGVVALLLAWTTLARADRTISRAEA